MKLGLLICSYNRPEYLSRCLESLYVADLPSNIELLIVDDGSTDERVSKLIHFDPRFTVIEKSENKSIKDSIIVGCDYLFNNRNVDLVCNLDGDAIVRKDFISVLISLKEKFPAHIVTGFNCLTRNRDGSERHKVLMRSQGFNLKKSVGGLNMLFDRYQYNAWVRPATLRCLETQGNWDHQTCIRSELDGKEIVCSEPSVVQHIGFESSMRHSLSEQPDVADDFISDEYQAAKIKLQSRTVPGVRVDIEDLKKVQLPTVTLVGADCIDIERLIRAADISCQDIKFADVKLFSSLSSLKHIGDKRIIPIQPLRNKSDYSVFIMKELAKHVNTAHMLVIQYDGYVLNADAWRDEWFQYDYIGAPWWYTDGMNVGNGGFSFRSKRLMDIVASDQSIIPQNQPGVTHNKEEDHCIARMYRPYLESRYKIKFAPIEVAKKFSIEGWNTPNRTWDGEFGFHSLGVDITKAK